MMDHSCPCSQNSWYHLVPIYNPYSLKFISFGCLLWRISDISLSERDIVWKSVDVWIIEYVSYSVDRFFLGSGSMSSLSLLPKSCMKPSITSAILFAIWFWFKTYNWSQHSKSLPSPPLGGQRLRYRLRLSNFLPLHRWRGSNMDDESLYHQIP